MRRFIKANAYQPRMAQFAMNGPFDERDLYNHIRLHPVDAKARQARASGEWVLSSLDLIESGPAVGQELRVQTCADFSCKHEIAPVIISGKQCAEPGAASLWIRESANNEFLRSFAFHFQPMGGSPVFIGRRAAFRDHA